MKDPKEPDNTIDPKEWAETFCSFSDDEIKTAGLDRLFEMTIEKFRALYPERLGYQGLRWCNDNGCLVSDVRKVEAFEVFRPQHCVFCRCFRDPQFNSQVCDKCPINLWATTPCYDMSEYRHFQKTGDPGPAIDALKRMRKFFRRFGWMVLVHQPTTNKGGDK